MTPLFQAIFACGLASARYARLRSTTRPSIPNLQKRIYTTSPFSFAGDIRRHFDIILVCAQSKVAMRVSMESLLRLKSLIF